MPDDPNEIHVAKPVTPLSKEMAQAETLRALQTCFPDRWEEIWTALGRESAADKTAGALVKTTINDPVTAAGALIGGVLGAALARGAKGRLP